jgi:surface protein
MKRLSEYITEWISSGSRKKEKTIIATDETIHQIVKDELDRLGHDADLNHIDVSEVTNMRELFNLGAEYSDLNPDISQWDVSSVTDMTCMFMWCGNFNKDISKWNVRNVEKTNWMFYRCEKFDQDISGWRFRKLREKKGMFFECPIRKEFKPKFK